MCWLSELDGPRDNARRIRTLQDNEANNSWRRYDEEVFAGYGWSDCIGHGVAAIGGAIWLPAGLHQGAAPMIAAVYDWSGFYIGINGGWGSSRKCWTITTPAGTLRRR